LRSLVSTAKKQDDGVPVLTVIHAVARSVMNTKFPNPVSDETPVPEIPVFDAIEAPFDRDTTDDIFEALKPVSENVLVAVDEVKNFVFLRLHLSVSYKRHSVKGARGAGG
jgi:hypothetical protein